MARIPESEIRRLKKEVDLVALVRSRGIELKKHSAQHFIGLCPFHDDKNTPNFIVTPAKGLFHCLSCGNAGNSIQFVERIDGLSFRHAFELLNGGSAITSEPKKTRPLDCLLNPESSDAELLNEVVNYYHQRLLLPENEAARDYLDKRGLDNQDLIEKFKLGFADRSLGLRLPSKQVKKGAELRKRLEKLGLYRKETGHEHFNGSLVVPIFTDDQVTEVYGRKITERLRKGTPKHLYLPGPHYGIFNPEALQQREIILCESLIDALTFYRHGMEAVTTAYGTNGFTDELLQALLSHKIESVKIAFDNDDSGERAFLKIAQTLQSHGLQVHRIKFPLGQDANSFGLEQGGEALRHAVRSAEWLDSPSSSPTTPTVETAEQTSSFLAAEVAAPAVQEATKEKSNPVPPVNPVEKLQSTETGHLLELGPRSYRIRGLEKNNSLEVLKVNLKASHGTDFHLDQIDLYQAKQREAFIIKAAQELQLTPELLKRDLGKLLLALENEQEQRLKNASNAEPSQAKTLTPEEHKEALALLQSPDLLDHIAQAFDTCGVVGERTNKLTAYLACVSRKLPKPLAVIIQSTSAAGKSTLMEAVLKFFPEEEQIKYSAMTGQSLYYLGETNLKHKILAIVEEEGAEKASYALKLLQSEGELTIASTGKDPQSGRMETQQYHVEGPVMIFLTTTAIDIDEELMNRCLVLSVDESKEQTQRIHQLQREAETLQGLQRQTQAKQQLTLLKNAQRLLEPLHVVNPFAPQLTFMSERTRTRRDHMKYLTLIRSIALLHQHQRSKKQQDGLTYIEVTKDDIALANQLAPEVLGRSLDELPPQTRRLLAHIKTLVSAKMDKLSLEQKLTLFTRKDLREVTGWSNTQIRTHLERLLELEYLTTRSGKNGVLIKYELLVDASTPEQPWHIDLLNLDQLPKAS